MRALRTTMAIAAVLTCAAGAWAIEYTWTAGAGSPFNWDDACNWMTTESCDGFPDGTGDIARIEFDSGHLPGPWEILQKQFTIGYLTIKQSVNFTGSETLESTVVKLTLY